MYLAITINDSWQNETCDSLLLNRDIIQFEAYQCYDYYSWWWFQIFFIFTSTWGNDPI